MYFLNSTYILLFLELSTLDVIDFLLSLRYNCLTLYSLYFCLIASLYFCNFWLSLISVYIITSVPGVFYLPLQISASFTLLCCPRKLYGLHQQNSHGLWVLLGLASGDLQQEMGRGIEVRVFIPLTPPFKTSRPNVFLSQKSLHLNAANATWLSFHWHRLLLCLLGLGAITTLTTGSGSLLRVSSAFWYTDTTSI